MQKDVSGVCRKYNPVFRVKKKRQSSRVYDCLFNYKLIIKNVLYQPMLFTAFVKRETFLAQLFL